MQEIKHNFTGGKMNKDLDERLVPNGEYRHAMNIQVSTSDGSDVGAIQNILGNSKIDVPLADENISNVTCIGSVSDEKSDSSYFFLSGPQYDYSQVLAAEGQATISLKDYIIRLKNNEVKTIFADVKLIRAFAPGMDNLAENAFDYTNNKINLGVKGAAGILVGDVLERVVNAASGATELVSSTVTKVVHGVDDDYVIVDNLKVNFAPGSRCYLFFKSGCLGFDSGRLITGINIIDEMLFWTDGVTEPKKINIQRSILGTEAHGNARTALVSEEVTAENYDQQGLFSYGPPVREEHITVIKQAPSRPPVLKTLTSLREGSTRGEALGVNFTVGGQGSVLLPAGSSLTIMVSESLSSSPPLVEVGDIILLNHVDSGMHPPENYEVRALVESVSIDALGLRLDIKLMTISPNTPKASLDFFFVVSEEGRNLFERKFPRFACRYKYKDGEYSSISPFSATAFIPGGFRYHPTEAYNKGMINNLKSLELIDFVPKDIPDDVVEIDLLYKDEASPNIYTIKSIKPVDNAWQADGSYPGVYGSYKITTENIYAALPSNQGLRLWDNVPRSALAQEVIGGRLIYANYLQNYNLKTLPSIIASLGSRATSDGGFVASKSIKSLRTYNVGVAYGDKYGRETPVFADENSNQIVAKDSAAAATMLNTEITSEHPSWAKYYKFFVKETSNEYYNLALGRVYDAKDGNIWLAFPSVDRNKVDEDTYLILKKGIDNTVPVTEKAKYKIVAIENEAPDYIKTSYVPIATPISSPTTSTDLVFAGAGLTNTPRVPVVGGVSFYIDKEVWTGDVATANKFGMPDLLEQWGDRGSNDLYVSFSGDTLSSSNNVFQESGKYLITNVVFVDAVDAVDTERAVYEVFIGTPILQIDSWISEEPGGVTWTRFRPTIYKKEIDNKPEFDGRFFVKIQNEFEIREKYLKKEEIVDTTWKVLSNKGIYYLRDSNAYDINAETLQSQLISNLSDLDPNNSLYVNIDDTTRVYNGVGNVENIKGDAVDGVFTKEQWTKVLGFGGDTPVSRWFIDQTNYAGNQNLTTTNWSGSTVVGPNNDHDSQQTYLRPSYQFYNATTGSHGTYFSLGIGLYCNTGISASYDADLPNAREHKLKLSYSMVGPSTIQTSPFSMLQPGPNDWEVGDPANTHNEDQAGFVSHIKPGSIFRMRSEPDLTYTITSVSKIRIYNYRGQVPLPYYGSATHHSTEDDWSKWKWMNDRGHSTNKRLCYDITYTINSGALSDDLKVNNGLDGVNAFTSGDFQFIEAYNVDDSEPISPNPAIFETEPKEDTGLDIYYEASGRVPTSITGGDGEMLIPPGSTIRVGQPLEAYPSNLIINPLLQLLSEGVTVTAWGGHNSGGVYQNNILRIQPPVSMYGLYSYLTIENDILGFNTPSGDIAYVEVIDAIEDNDQVRSLEVKQHGKTGLNWFNCWSFGNGVESNRVGDTYNKPFLTNGAKVSTTLDKKYEEEHRKYGLIYSGIFNSMSGVNNLNQFIAAEKITKDINPIYGSIQRLHTRSTADGDLIALCEDRVLKILADRDAVFNADGNPQLVATNNVLGQALPYAGEYGISTNPESFASESYRVYFTDKVRGTVMRLSKDGLTSISDHGMKNWFRENLKLSSKIIGSYDDRKDEYNVTLAPRSAQTYQTVASAVLKSTVAVMIPSTYNEPDDYEPGERKNLGLSSKLPIA